MKPLKLVPAIILILSLLLASFVSKRTQIIADKPDLKDMVFVQTGTFMMGLDSAGLRRDMQRFGQPASFFSQEFPASRVTVVPFYLDKFDVTNQQFKKFIDANPYWSKRNIPDSLQDGNYLKEWNGNKYPKGQGDYPVTYVSYYAAYSYARWLGKRLPMDAELEFAAKGVGHPPITFPWGDADAGPDKASFSNTSNGHTVKVGSFPPNNLGIYDMAGNVYQLCLDRWRPDSYAKNATFKASFKTAPRSFPPMTQAEEHTVVIRGGSWNDPPEKLRTTYREGYAINRCTAFVGFRCAANAPR